MLTIPRVAQLRICGHLTTWLWSRLCLFISDKEKRRKKEDSLCGWWLGHWFYWNVLLMEHTHKQAVSISNSGIIDFLWWKFSDLTGNHSESRRMGRFYFSVFFLIHEKAPCPQQLLMFMIPGMLQGQWICPMFPSGLLLWTSWTQWVFLLIVFPSNSSAYPITQCSGCFSTQDTSLSTCRFCLWVLSSLLMSIFPASSCLTFQVLVLQAHDVSTRGLYDTEDKTQNLLSARFMRFSHKRLCLAFSFLYP